MKRFVLAVALTGLLSMTVLAGNVPINGAAAPTPTTTSSTTSTSSSTLLVTVILTVLGLR